MYNIQSISYAFYYEKIEKRYKKERYFRRYSKSFMLYIWHKNAKWKSRVILWKTNTVITLIDWRHPSWKLICFPVWKIHFRIIFFQSNIIIDVILKLAYYQQAKNELNPNRNVISDFSIGTRQKNDLREHFKFIHCIWISNSRSKFKVQFNFDNHNRRRALGDNQVQIQKVPLGVLGTVRRTSLIFPPWNNKIELFPRW